MYVVTLTTSCVHKKWEAGHEGLSESMCVFVYDRIWWDIKTASWTLV